MAKKKAKGEVIQQPDTSNREENKVGNSVSVSASGMNNSKNSEEKPTFEDLEGVWRAKETVDGIMRKESKKLKLLAADRLNSLINEANELGITDVVQILNSDKYGQFYMMYRQ